MDCSCGDLGYASKLGRNYSLRSSRPIVDFLVGDGFVGDKSLLHSLAATPTKALPPWGSASLRAVGVRRRQPRSKSGFETPCRTRGVRDIHRRAAVAVG